MLRRTLDRRGQGQTEYGLIIVLLGLACIGMLYFFGTSTSTTLNTSADRVGSAGQTQGTTGGGGL
ncbi:MAG: Flp family type IVb pilin [Candidatus Riflebacteria bacterium]|nr:Flp family type IVb pilin [Candidatus Riflebacteria bacterium]